MKKWGDASLKQVDWEPLFWYHELSPIPAVATGIRAIPETVALPHEKGERA